MDEISNRTLAILLIGAIVISLGGTLISLNKLGKIKVMTLTGFAGTNLTLGNVSLEITDLTWINFSIKRCNFGTGYIAGASTFCDMNSSGRMSSGCIGFTANTGCNSAFEIRNIGNKNVSLNISWALSGPNFLSDTAGRLYFRMGNGTNGTTHTSQGCRVSLLPLTWTQVTANGYHNETCADFTTVSTNQYVHMNVRVNITKTATAGYKSNRIYAYGKTK
ncbi:MAG: hypothetical protein ABIF10_08275 [Candidatus Woesearchaeota archaeon]